MAASSLVNPIVTAFATGRAAMDPTLEHIALEIRPDGGVERVLPAMGSADDAHFSALTQGVAEFGLDVNQSDAGDSCCGTATANSCCVASPAGHALRQTLSRVIPMVAEVSGAGVASLWAIVADAVGNRALDSGDQEAGARLAREVAGRLPVPRFADFGGRTFVRRISCCLVFEVPGCEMCTSCPKRPAAEREMLLAELAARG
ncbi:(2Fe-2S)-binding protein [Nocardia sp. NPDC051030]|uniref:(2Fe-2S)-binding protein n=1 Tax=Nocardia sp. NPDC051030 TaxID=3155162 RepID=UPI00341EE1DD